MIFFSHWPFPRVLLFRLLQMTPISYWLHPWPLLYTPTCCFSRFYALLCALVTINTPYAIYSFLIHHCTNSLSSLHIFVHHCTFCASLHTKTSPGNYTTCIWSMNTFSRTIPPTWLYLHNCYMRAQKHNITDTHCTRFQSIAPPTAFSCVMNIHVESKCLFSISSLKISYRLVLGQATVKLIFEVGTLGCRPTWKSWICSKNI